MSDGDFAEQLRQSVQDQLALIQSAARAAKARIGQGIATATAASAPSSRSSPAATPPPPPPPPVPEYGEAPVRSGAAVDFFADEPPQQGGLEPEDPAFAAAVEGGGEGLPEGSIEFDNYAQEGMDDDGIPVWEEPP